MNSIRKSLLWVGFMLLPFCTLQAQQDVEVIVVTGKRPGPPLWRVSNGDNTLWILPLISAVPKDMEWDDARVAQLIAAADEVIDEPNVSFGVPRSMIANPVNAFRALRLWKRLSVNPDGQTLKDLLPADLYRRYAAFKSSYFARAREIDKLRPSLAAEQLRNHVLDAEKLTSPNAIKRRVERHIRRNRGIVRTEMDMVHTVTGSYGEISERAESLMGSLRGEQEIACFDLQLGVFERHLDDMKVMANAWANGAAAELEDFTQSDSLDNPCAALLADSSEGELMMDMQRESRARWLAAAQAALEKNGSTFAMLPLAQVVGEGALVTELATLGFTLHDPR